jgi:hypothetical protein
MDDIDRALSDLIGFSTVAIADEDRAYRLVVKRAHGRIRSRRLATSAVTLGLVAAIVIIAAVTGTHHTGEVRVQGRPSSVPTSPTPSACVVSTFSPPSWPKSGTLPSVSPADAAATARRFVATELGVAHVSAVSELKISNSGCTVHVRVGKLQGIVSFIDLSTQRYVVAGFNLGEISGGSMQVTGRHVDVFYDPECLLCTSREMHIRYGDAVTSVGPTRSSHMTADLSKDPRVSGGYVFVGRLSDGSIGNALATTISPGNFAAS